MIKTLLALVLCSLITVPYSGFTNDVPCGGLQCNAGDSGTFVGASKKFIRSLATPSRPAGNSSPRVETWTEYSWVIDCPGNTPDQPDMALCGHAVQFCEENQPGSSGPYSIIYQRQVSERGPESPWERLVPTCYTDAVPARSAAPAELTEAMIVEQFHRTDFALPELRVEPPGGDVLVNLPVYAEIRWPDTGFEPGEVDTTTLAGQQVRIRPNLESVTYDFGDGTTFGPTSSLGGGYPDGDVTHIYAGDGDFEPTATVTFAGEVSVDGGDWATVPGTAEITGPSMSLTAHTSRNRLYTNPD